MKKRFTPFDEVLINGKPLVYGGERVHVDLESIQEGLRRLHEESLKAEAAEQARKNRPKV